MPVNGVRRRSYYVGGPGVGALISRAAGARDDPEPGAAPVQYSVCPDKASLPRMEKAVAARAIWAGKTGLEIKALPPLSEQRDCDSVSERPVTSTMGVERLARVFRIREQAMKPSMPGMRTSMKMTS